MTMTRWKGHADKDAETAGGGWGNFEPAARGIYTIQVANFKDGITQTGRPMVTLECEIADQGPHFGKKVWLNVTEIPEGEKGHGIFIHYCHAFGLEIDGDYDFDTGSFQGKKARALLGVEPRESKNKKSDGTPYINMVNWVEAVYTENHPEPKELPPPMQRKQPAGKPTIGKPPAREEAGRQGEPEEVPF